MSKTYRVTKVFNPGDIADVYFDGRRGTVLPRLATPAPQGFLSGLKDILAKAFARQSEPDSLDSAEQYLHQMGYAAYIANFRAYLHDAFMESLPEHDSYVSEPEYEFDPGFYLGYRLNRERLTPAFAERMRQGFLEKIELYEKPVLVTKHSPFTLAATQPLIPANRP